MRFKSVLGAFLFILLASFIALIVFVQTKSFGELITHIVSDLSESRLKTKVKIRSLSISVFPPGLELNQMSFNKKISKDESIQAEFGKIGFYINLIEVEEKKLTFGEIRIADSVINYQTPEKEDEDVKEIDREMIKKVFDLSNETPVRIDTILIENSRIIVNHELVEARRLKLFKKDASFVARFHLSNINPTNDPGLKIDEVWGDAEISRKNIKIERLKAQHDVHSLLLKGVIKNYYKLKGSEVSLIGEAQVHLRSLGDLVPEVQEMKISKGVGKASFQVTYKNNSLKVTSDIFAENIKSGYFYADEMRGNVSIEDNKLIAHKLNLVYKDQKAQLVEPVLLYNFNDDSYLQKPIRISLNNFSFENALRFLGKRLEDLKGYISGNLAFEYKNRNYYFRPANNFVIKKLGLVTGTKEDPFKVIMMEWAEFKNAQFSVINNVFHMSASIKLPRSQFPVEGFVSKDKVKFTIPMSPIDLEDLGNLANLDVKGAGQIAVDVSGPLEQTIINLRGKTDGFEILGYRLGTTDKNISVDLGSRDVIINKMDSTIGKTNITGNGSVNYKSAEIALGISSNNTNYSDLTQILHPIFTDLDFLPEDLNFQAKIDVDIFGKYKVDDLKIKSRIHFNDMTAYGENFNSGSVTLTMADRKLAFKSLNVEKASGTIFGDFFYGLKDKSIELHYQWENLKLSSFNISKRLGLNLQSDISGKISGRGTASNYNLKLESTAFNTGTSNYTFGDSYISTNIMNDRIAGKANILGDIIVTDFNLALKQGAASDFKIHFKAHDLKPFLVAIFGPHLENENFTGNVEFVGETSFEDGFNELNLTGTLKELSFNHPDFNVNYISDTPQFEVMDSVIQKWDLNIKQQDFFFVTKGEGVFGKTVSLVHESHFNSKILEVLIAPLLSAEGSLQNITRINGRGSEFDISISSRANNLDLSIERLPVQINDLKYTLEYSDKRLEIQNLSTSLDNGSINVVGDIFFDNFQPDVNLKFNLDKAEIPILGKSTMNLSGEGIILGNNYPYTLGGEIIVNKALIVNELNEFSTKSAGFSQVRFLPKNQESPFGKMFNLNLNVKAENPVRITNSLMDVALTGEVRLLGSPSRIRGEGKLSTPLNSSQIFFKNNEYIITRAELNFNQKKDIFNPDFDVEAVTFISTYKVFPKAYGDLERFNFDLTSEPALPRNSILSLIAFGYTDEIQSTLDPKDQQNLTGVGVGSFVFDRFKINDILNKQFGLQVSLGTVIEQSSTDSLLSGRSQDGNGQGTGALGRTKSATKIELKKRLDEALTLSVSSTMGGSIGQRQSMNLNYGISKNIQVEGVYELKTNEEGEADIIYDSIGGDIKFRRTFK